MSLNVLQWNCRGYYSNYENLILLIKEYQPCCIVLQETMHGSKPIKAPRGYCTYATSNTSSNAGQGLAIFVRNDTPSTRINISSTINSIAVSIHLKTTVTICNIYYSPAEIIETPQLKHLTDQLPNPYLLLGDFNARNLIWGDNIVNRNGREMATFLSEEDVTLLNDGSGTRFNIQTGTSSNLDLSICSPQLLPALSWKVDEELYGSDHFPIIISHLEEPNEFERRFNVKKADWGLYRALTDLSIPLDSDVNSCVSQLEDVIHKAAEGSIPLTKITPGRKTVPWWNQSCDEARRCKKTALRKYQRTKTVQDKVALKKARALSRYTQKQSRRSGWRDFVASINIDTPMNLVYSKINRIIGKRLSQPTPCLEVGGQQLHHPKDIANALATHFHRVSSESCYSPSFRAIKEVAEREELDFTPDEEYPYNETFSSFEMDNALKRCKNTAPGPDGVHYLMLKHLSPRMKQYLLEIFNKCWTEGVLPERWSEATILPFPKPNKPPSQPTSYRPIALTSCVCKLFEKMVNARLHYALESRQVLHSAQNGFRRMRGTEDALVWLESTILSAFARKKHVVGIFFDVEKAYDTTWRFGILRKLHRSGIRGHIAVFVKNFLSKRVFRVKVNSTLSQMKTQEQGVPQGSVLSCLLFLVAINDIVDSIPPMVKPSLYVDDLAIFMEATFIDSAQRVLQRAVDAILDWADRNGFRLSAEKTTGVVFHRKRMVSEPRIMLYTTPIKFESRTRFLGLIFDQQLRWEPHIVSLRARAIKATNILRVLGHLRWGSDRLSLLRIYRTLIRSKLDYGSQVYATAKETTLHKLSVVHHICIRLCTGAFRSSPVLSLYAESGEPSLDYRRDQLTLQHFCRIQRLTTTPTYMSVNADHDNRSFFEQNPAMSQPMGCRIAGLMEKYGMANVSVLPCTPSAEPTWRCQPDICKELLSIKKSDYHPSELKQRYLEHRLTAHDQATTLFTDGSKTSTSSGYAVVMDNRVLSTKTLRCEASIYTCELSAIFDALKLIPRRSTSAVIASDSLSSLQGIADLQSSNAIVNNIQKELLKLQRNRVKVTLCWVPSHVGVTGNELADRAAQEAASRSTPGEQPLPYSDFYPYIKKKIADKWQNEWRNTTNNKLREVKPTVKSWSSSSSKHRTSEVSLCRLRIGHTLYTHQHLMERRGEPVCALCQVPLTVKHFLVECSEYTEIRNRVFQRRNPTLTDILTQSSAFSLPKLMEFLGATNLYNKI